MGDDEPRRRSQDLIRDNPLFAVIMENQNRLEGKIDTAISLIAQKADTQWVQELATKITVVEGKLDHRASVHHDLANSMQRLSGKTDALTAEVAMLKVKSGLWGAAAGLVPAALIALVSFLGGPGA